MNRLAQDDSMTAAMDATDFAMDAEDRRISLFNRYTALGDEAAAMRKTREALQEEIETMQEKELALHHEELRLRRDTDRADGTIETFQRKIQRLDAEYQKVKEATNRAIAARDTARSKRDDFLAYANKNRLGFLAASLDFRSTCKRLRVSAMACGLEHAAIQAFLETNGEDTAVYDGLDGLLVDLDDLEDDPASWKFDANDEDVFSQLEVYLKNKKAHEIASNEYDIAEADKVVVWKRLQNRQAQEDNLQGQAERIAKDNAELELQIHGLQRQTNDAESKMMAMRRRKSLTNPYMQKKNKASTAAPSASLAIPSSRLDYDARGQTELEPVTMSGRRGSEQRVEAHVSNLPQERRSQLQNVAWGQVSGIDTNHHFVGGGRSRRNRQFGLRLHVDGEQMLSYEHEPAADATNIGLDTRQRNETSSDDEDDDDDDVLLFRAFPDKKA